MSDNETNDREAIARQIYDPLPVGKNETRLLVLHAGELEDVLSAELVLVELRAAEFPYTVTGMRLASTDVVLPYLALSYTWGPPLFDHLILVNGYRYHITESLSLALQNLRSTSEDQYIWADALCIDQFNLKEKSMQIRNMGFIYQEARLVVVWLGLPHGTMSTALDFALALEKRQSDHLGDSEAKIMVDLLDGRIELVEPIARGFVDMLSHPWFKRAWVVQEVNLAQQHRFRCGSHELGRLLMHRLPSLLAILVVLSERHAQEGGTEILPDPSTDVVIRSSPIGKPPIHGPNRQDALDLIPDSLNGFYFPWIRSTAWKSTILDASVALNLLIDVEGHLSNTSGPPSVGNNLTNLLLLASHLKATDDRDRIYALMALISLPAVYADEYDGDVPCVRIDYSRSTSQVYQQVAKLIMHSAESYDILYRKFKRQDDDSELSTLDLPSWTPDWRCIGNMDMITAVMPGRDHSLLSDLRDFDAQSRWPHLFQWNSPDGVLPVSGYPIGMVTRSESTADAGMAGNSTSAGPAHVFVQHSPLWSAIMVIMLGDLHAEPEPLPLKQKLELQSDETEDVSNQLSKMRKATLDFLDTVQHSSEWTVCSHCQEGDWLIQISGGLLPIVLREVEQGSFRYIGYAVIAGDSYTKGCFPYRWLLDGREATPFGNEFSCQTDLLVHVSRFLLRERKVKEVRFRLI